MTVYYVRKTGADTDAGTAANTAWLTIDKAANTVAAGDTVYIGAGVYRELVPMDANGSSGSQNSYIGDVDAYFSGEAGLVIISAYDVDDTSQVARAASLTRTAGRLSPGAAWCSTAGKAGRYIAPIHPTIITKAARLRTAYFMAVTSCSRYVF